MYEAITKSLTAVVNFSEEELFLFMQKLKPLTLKKHDFYLKEGNVCKSMVIVQKGGLRYFSRGEKGEYTDGFAFEGEWLGDYESFLLQVPSAHFIEALEDSEIFALSFNDMQYLYDLSPRFERFGRIIAENLFIATAKSKRNLMLQSAEDRYIDLLTSQPHIFERLPQHLIASFLGIQPQSLSRIRAKISAGKLT